PTHSSPPSFSPIDTTHTHIYTLSLHDALPISLISNDPRPSTTRPPLWPEASQESKAVTDAWYTSELASRARKPQPSPRNPRTTSDRKSTRLNSSHVKISYAVFCLKKKNNKQAI